MEIRVVKQGNEHPKIFSYPDLDYEDSMAAMCATLDEMHQTNGFLFEVLSQSPIVALHYFGQIERVCVECLEPMASNEFNGGTDELPVCMICLPL